MSRRYWLVAGLLGLGCSFAGPEVALPPPGALDAQVEGQDGLDSGPAAVAPGEDAGAELADAAESPLDAGALDAGPRDGGQSPAACPAPPVLGNSFESSSGRVVVFGDASAFALQPRFAISFWVKLLGPDLRAAVLLDRSGADNAPSWRIELRPTSKSGSPALVFHADFEDESFRTELPLPVDTLNRWLHVRFQRDKTFMASFLDGKGGGLELIGIDFEPLGAHRVSFRTGLGSTSPMPYRLFGVELSTEVIEEDFTPVRRPLPGPQTIALWLLDEPPGVATVRDATCTSNGRVIGGGRAFVSDQP